MQRVLARGMCGPVQLIYHAGMSPHPPRIVLCFLLPLISAAQIGAQGETTLVIAGVTLIDGTGRAPVANTHVLVRNDRIVAVSSTPLDVPVDTTHIDGRGKFLIPGMMDMHVHVRGGRSQAGEPGLRTLHGFLYSGFTTIYDAGNDPDFIYGLRDKQRAGEITSPRIFATGSVITVPGGHGWRRGSPPVESWPEAIAALDEHIARGPDLLKLTFDEHGWGTRPLIPLLDPDLMTKIVDYYHQHGIRTTVHISHEYRARQAIIAGVDTLAHPIIQGPVSREFVQILASTKVPMVTTLTIGEGYSRLVEHPEFLDQPLYQAVLEPADIARQKGSVRDGYDARPWTWWMKIMTPVCQENLRQIHAGGGILAIGSDQSLGPASHRELELLADAGVHPLEVIRAATLNGAIFLGKEREMGSIEVGKLADMVLLTADPSVDIDNAKEIDTVILGGAIVDRSSLDLPVNRR